ncbi:MAG: hypothetical protein AAF773_23500 [Cyanobacteria bacterium P01_D01_bin.115]
MLFVAIRRSLVVDVLQPTFPPYERNFERNLPISMGTHPFEPAVAFDDAVMPPLRGRPLGTEPDVAADGREVAEFWVPMPFDGQPANVGNDYQLSFGAESTDISRGVGRGGDHDRPDLTVINTTNPSPKVRYTLGGLSQSGMLLPPIAFLCGIRG